MASNNHTKLKNTLMYGHDHRKNNYFRKFKDVTNNNNIDDPIYTGFTLSIDTTTSPLFYSNYPTDSEIASRIEEKLADVWKNIKSNGAPKEQPHSVKDSFSNGKRVGFGLQENVFGEELLYGAVDYIYMVDKVVDEKTSNLDNLATLSEKTTMDNGIDESSDNASEIERLNTAIEVKKKERDEAQTLLDALDEFDDEQSKENESIQEIIDSYHKFNDKKKELESELFKQRDNISSFRIELQKLQSDAIDDFKLNEGENVTQFTTKLDDLIARAAAVGVLILSDPNITNNKKAAEKWGGNTIDAKYYNTDEKLRIVAMVVDGELSIRKFEENIKEHEKEKPENYSETIKFDGKDIPVLEYEEMLKNNPNEETKQQETVDRINNDLLKLIEQRDAILVSSIGETNDDGGSVSADVDSVNTRYGQAEQSAANQQASDNLYQNISASVPQSVLDMIGFITDMDNITINYPYMFLSVSGLDTAYKKYFNPKDPYYGSGDDTISIECLESLDMKMSAMFNKYFNATYDRQWRRERIPVNLRRFNCSIFVHDIRNFREALSRIKSNAEYDKNGDNASSYIIELALNYLSVVEFKFFDCEIIPEETGGIFGNVSDENMGEPLRTQFTFKYGNCFINFLPFDILAKNYNGGLQDHFVKHTISTAEYVSTPSDVWNKQSFMDDAKITDNIGDLSKFNDEKKIKKMSKDEIAEALGDTSGIDYRRYWDTSVLGNVGNDDYLDYIKRDHPTAVDDFLRNRYSNMFANNSAGQIQDASTQLDDILNRTIRGISASIGEPATTIADVLGVGYLNNAFHGEKPVGKTEELGNAFDSTDTKGKTDEIQSDKPNTDTKGTSQELGMTDTNPDALNSTTGIGNTGTGKPSNSKSKELGVTDGSQKSTGTTDGIGDMIDKPNSTGTSTNMGNLNPDINSSGTTTGLGHSGNQYDGNVSNSGEIGTVQVTGETTGVNSDLGKFDLERESTGVNSDLGKFDLERESTGTNTDLGKFDLSGEATGVNSDLGKFDLSGESTGSTTELGVTGNKYEGEATLNTEIGIVDVKGEKPNGQYSKLGSYDLSGEATGVNSDLGKFDLERESIGTNTDLGKFDLERKSTDVSSDLGNFDVKYPSVGETKELGAFDLSAKSTGTNEDLGKFDLERESKGMNEDLGKYNLESEPTGVNEDLGKFDLERESTGINKDLGKFDLSAESKGTNEELGAVNVKGASKGKTENLGNQPTSKSPTDDTFSNLGNVFRD